MANSNNPKKEYVFGPVPSRRLGRSLGIDLVPFKTCSYDCLYCQVGLTTDKTVERKFFVPIDDIISELKTKLDSQPDYITLSGSGEPTLYAGCEKLISSIKEITDVSVAVITNGSMLCFEDVRRAIMPADLVVPSLDAGDAETFEKINRPACEITFDKMLAGLIEFRRQFKGDFWLEVFFIEGINDSDEQVEKLAVCIEKISPDKVQLNTVVRPPAESNVRAVSKDWLERIAGQIYKNAEIIADYSKICQSGEFSACAADVLEMLKRRPCSAEDVSAGLSIHPNETAKYIAHLADAGKIEPYNQDGKIYYKAII